MVDTSLRLPPEAYITMSRVLRIGLVISMVILLAALGVFAFHHSGEDSQTLVGTNPITHYLTPPGLVHGLLGLQAEAFMTLGILILAITPALRVLTGLVYFVRDGDRPLALISLAVFLMLLLGFLVIGPVLK